MNASGQKQSHPTETRVALLGFGTVGSAVAHLLQDQQVPGVQHERLVRWVALDFATTLFAHHIRRSVYIGDPANNKTSSHDLLAWGNCIHQSPFRNLASFTCLDASANVSVLDRLSDSPSLTSLTLVWGGHRDLDLHKFGL